MKHTFLYPLHIAVPVIGSILFLLYYHVSDWDEMMQISGFIQVIGIALPFVIALICAGNVSLEEENHFQPFLGTSVCKWHTLFAKWMVLEALALLSIIASVCMFACGYHWILGKEALSSQIYGLLILFLWLGSIPLYLEHLFLNFTYSKAASLGAGVAQLLLSALFLTGLGDGKWQFFPSTWSVRWTSLILTVIVNDGASDFLIGKVKTYAMICLLITVVIYVIIRMWFYFYEGRQCDE